MAEGEDVLAKMGQDLIKESYGDLVKPIAKDFGEALAGIFKAITYYPRYWAMTSEISLEEKVAKFKENLSKKVEVIPPELKILPSPSILGPSIQALEYAVIEDDISDMFANLIASSMNSSKSRFAHPSFVEIIKQITPDEAKILKFLSSDSEQPVIDVKVVAYGTLGYRIEISNMSFIPEESGCEHIKLGSSYLENLSRLKIVEIPIGISLVDDSFYQRLEAWFVKYVSEKPPGFDQTHSLSIEKKLVHLTNFGQQFITACVLEKSVQSQGVPS
jgi:Abortive infection alpha